MYTWLDIRSPEDFAQLHQQLDAVFGSKRVVEILTNGINSAVCGVLIERSYIDKDYRSTYYHFYAKMGREYRSDCVRLHFFDAAVSFDAEALDLRCDDNPEHHYYGYMVLRPTMVSTIGRTVLSPDVRRDAKGMVITSKHKVHLLGRTLRLHGFPSMDQHADIAVCAHVACWSILRHYSERYALHRELLVHDIKVMAHQFDPGGLVPGNGLDVYEAERVFLAAGTYPLLVSKHPKSPDDFYAQMLAYLDSGFPLFVAMEGKGHAIVTIGRSWRDEANAAAGLTGENASSRVSNFTVIDDNYLPYRCVPVHEVPDCQYSADDFDRFIVPLPEKIFYPASAVGPYAKNFAKYLRSHMPLPPEDETVTRYFITTVAALRQFVRDNASQLGPELVAAVMQLETAQFVWVVEYASAAQWARGEIAARAVLDASASPRDSAPLWMAHGMQTAIFFDRSTVPPQASVIALTTQAGASLGRMEQNLRPILQRP